MNPFFKSIFTLILKESLIRKGQVGTVVMDFEQKAFLIDFADENGVTYAMETIPKESLIPLLYQAEEMTIS